MKLSPLAIGMGVGAAFAAALWFFGSVSHTSVRSAGPVAVTVASPATAPAPSAAAKTNLQTFFVRGVVKEVKADGKTVVIDHEEIPNYMAKMVMPFKVKDTNQLAGLGTNDQIHFRFNVAEYESWIDQVTKTGTAAAPLVDPNRKAFRPVREVEVLKEGDALPDYPFTNQRGEVFRTAEFKGRALAITFIFTRCPVPDFCPRMSYRFAQADKQLRALADGPTNYHLLSLSFDTDYDTPPVLQNYANTVKAQHGADLSRWTFATGKLIDIDDITERFGLVFPRDPEKPVFNHNLRTVIINAAGKVQKVFIGNDWKADTLVEEIVKAAKVRP